MSKVAWAKAKTVYLESSAFQGQVGAVGPKHPPGNVSAVFEELQFPSHLMQCSVADCPGIAPATVPRLRHRRFLQRKFKLLVPPLCQPRIGACTTGLLHDSAKYALTGCRLGMMAVLSESAASQASLSDLAPCSGNGPASSINDPLARRH